MNEETKPKEFPHFGELDSETINGRLIDVLSPLEYACPKLKLNWDDIRYNKKLILEIIDLIERRRAYFWIYHKIDMGELNEISLLCFWIIKFCPFYDIKNPNINVNIIFALYIFTSTIIHASDYKNKIPNFTLNVVKRLEHAFRYQDLSKESLMAMAECLAD